MQDSLNTCRVQLFLMVFFLANLILLKWYFDIFVVCYTNVYNINNYKMSNSID